MSSTGGAPGPAPIHAFETLDSTNAEARRRAEAGDLGPCWITAERQTAGRGRRGRAWQSVSGNLAATYLFATPRPPAQAAQISFVAALAVADLAQNYIPESRVRLKWPNDLLIGGRKAAGILVESGAAQGGGLWLAVGCGVNLASAPRDVDPPATSFSDHISGPPPTATAAAERLADGLRHWQNVWDRDGFAAIAQAWTRRAYGLGQSCAARLAHETIYGVAEGLDDDGALRLRLPDGAIRRVTAGDVFF